MKLAIVKVLRSLQTRAPAVRPMKFSMYNWATRLFGWHIEPEFKFLSRFAPATLALDIGGNWGQSIYALKRTARPRRIMSFEPNPVLARRLQAVFEGDRQVRVEPFGLSDASGHFDLFVPSYRNFIYDGLASLDQASAREWLNADRMAWFDPDKLRIDRHKVEIRTLDSFDLSPDIIKIDVQGLELAVVKGGIETFRRSRPVTIVEAPSLELAEVFAGLGLDPYGFSDGKLVRDDLSGTNTIFVHPERLR